MKGKTTSAELAESSNVMNLSVLEELAEGDKAFMSDMVKLFVNQAPRELKLLKIAISHRDYPAIKGIAHKMKTTAVYFGLDQAKKVFTELEKLNELEVKQNALAAKYQLIRHTYRVALFELKLTLKNLN